MATGSPGAEPKTRTMTMTFKLNQILDTVVSFAIVALGLTIACATALVGL